MTIANVSNKLKKVGLPKFWQLYALLLSIFSVSVIVMSNDVLLNISNIIITTGVSIGVFSAIKFHRHSLYPWALLSSGIALIGVSIILQSINYFGLETNALISASVEEVGMLLILLFSLSFMIDFEKDFNLDGFTIDFSLLAVSLIFLAFLLIPNLFQAYVYEMGLIKQLNIVNLVISIILFSMTILNHILCNKLLVKDVIRIMMILCLIVHFSLGTMENFQLIEKNSLSSRISWSAYHLAGVLAITFTFLESRIMDYNKRTSSRIGNQLTWTASILAIVTIPLGIIARDRLGLPSFEIMVIGIASFGLSSLVIWRLQKLIKNIDNQRSNLKRIAYTDPLTKLPNYHGYLDKLSNINSNNLFVVSINIEDFKSINDLHGRDFGDEVLISLAKRLKMSPNVILTARTGSDYFHAVFKTPFKNIPALVEDLQKYLGIWDTVKNHRIAVPLTYGASHSSDYIKPELLARRAEQALKMSREQHTNFTLYSEKNEINKKRKNELPRQELREILQKAVDDNYLPIHFQPIYNLNNGELKAMEMLIRVESEEHGLLLPGQFLDQAKSYGLLTSLTQVCINMVAKCYEQLPNVTININVPPYMLNNPQILNSFIHSFERAKLPISRFCVEITEDGDIPTDHLIPSIKLLKSYGFKIAMDDFGTGYSSLSRLSVLPVDIVKIDRSLLLAASAGNQTILESAISLSKRLGATAVVEGVETLEQLSLIKRLGADSVQGFLLSKPVRISKASLLSLNANDIIAEF